MATDTQAAKFEREKGKAISQPPPPFPRVPSAWIAKRPKDEQDMWNAYSDACQEWVRKYVQGQL